MGAGAAEAAPAKPEPRAGVWGAPGVKGAAPGVKGASMPGMPGVKGEASVFTFGVGGLGRTRRTISFQVPSKQTRPKHGVQHISCLVPGSALMRVMEPTDANVLNPKIGIPTVPSSFFRLAPCVIYPGHVWHRNRNFCLEQNKSKRPLRGTHQHNCPVWVLDLLGKYGTSHVASLGETNKKYALFGCLFK